MCDSSIDDNCNGQTDEGCTNFVGVRLFIEGFYIGNGFMNATVDATNYPSLCDTVVVELHEAEAHDIAFFVKGTIGIDGYGTFEFPFAARGNSYFITILLRNSIQTWSKTSVLIDYSL